MVVMRDDLDIEFNEMKIEISSSIQSKNGIFLDEFHTLIRRLQQIHPASSVSNHHHVFSS